MPEDTRLAPARAVIAKQVELIKAGDLEGLRAMVTDRLKDRITAEGLASAVRNLGNMTLEDLVAGVESVGDGLKLKMRNGRTLTTLVAVAGGGWKADTVWFK